MFIVDAHLDLAYNALRGRKVLLPAIEQKADEEGIPSVGLPDLRDGGVGLIGATLFCMPAFENHPGYSTPDEAHFMAQQQIRWYHQLAQEDELNLITTSATLPTHDDPYATGLNAIILMEGAEPIRNPEEVPIWFGMGVRIVGLAWRRTRYAGGTGEPGPLTDEGIKLVKALDQAGIIHDISHLAEDSFWHLLDISNGPIIASHSNCRTIVPTDRQITDEMIREIAARDGVIGINFFDKFLLPQDQQGKRRATLADVITHIRHICDKLGSAKNIGLGTDMDGGLGRDQIPQEIQTSADLVRVADALAEAKFPDADIHGIMGENWLKFFHRFLPKGSV